MTILGVGDELLQEFDFLLEHGVGVPINAGEHLQGMLERYGLPAEMLQNIRAFCDGEPVSQARDCLLQPGMLVQLGEPDIELEDGQDGQEEGEDAGQAEEALLAMARELARDSGAVWLRLGQEFLASLTGPLLRRGVLVPLPQTDAVLQVLPREFWEQSGGVLVHGRRCNPLTHQLRLPQKRAMARLVVRAPDV